MNSDAVAAMLPGWLHTHYGLAVTRVSRVASGTQSDNFRVHYAAGAVMVKVFRPDADLAQEQAILAVSDTAAGCGIPIPRLLPSPTGQLLHRGDGLAAAVWQWCERGSSAGQGYELGRVLARLHQHLRGHDDGSWPVAQPHYRRHTLNQIQQRFTALADHIAALPQPTADDEDNLQRIGRRLTQLVHMPDLLAAAGPPQRALVHGDFVRPNWLLDEARVCAVLDLRLKADDPVREIGRMAFDVQTIAATDTWLDVAEAALTGYLDHGGIVPASHLSGCARLALLHSMCSTYPVEELYLDPPPPHLRDDLAAYWVNRTVTVNKLLQQMLDVDVMIARVARLPVFPTPKPAPAPADPRQLLPVAVTARAHLLDQITANAAAAGVKALLLCGSGAAGTADPLADIDLIAVVDDTQPVAPQQLVAQLAEPAPLLFSRTVTHNGPHAGFYRGICAEVAGWPVWADIYLWPADTAAIPADVTVLFDHAGLPHTPTPLWELLDAHRAPPDGNPLDEPGAEHMLRALLAAKRAARRTADLGRNVPAGRQDAPTGTGTGTGIETLDRWITWCTKLAHTDWNRTPWQARILRRTSKSTTARVHGGDRVTVVKLLTGPDPYQTGLFTTETAVYRTHADDPAPAALPHMLSAGDRFLVISDVDAAMLHPDRYPRQPLPPQQVRAALWTLAQFAAWTPDTLPTHTQAAQLLHDKAAAMLTEEEADAYRAVRGLCRQRCPAHGDAIPSNLLIDPTGTCRLVDFENTGWHLPGYDYAVLRTVLATQPDTITAMIDQFAVEQAGNAAYTANLIAAAAREVRLHLLPTRPDRVARTRRHPGVGLCAATTAAASRRHCIARRQSMTNSTGPLIVLVTGVSGSGKTAVAKRLGGNGYDAVSLDSHPGLCQWTDDDGRPVQRPDQPTLHWLRSHHWRWNPAVLEQLIAEKRAGGDDVVWLARVAANTVDLADRFDLRILLHLDRPTMLRRVAEPQRGNDFGRTGDTLTLLQEGFDSGQQQLAAICHARVDATAPLDAVVNDLLIELGIGMLRRQDTSHKFGDGSTP